jgi:DNA-binding Xre family transcriptional regulator
MAEDCQVEAREYIRKKDKTMESIVELLEGFTFAEVLNILDRVKWHCSTLSVVGMSCKVKGLRRIRKMRGLKTGKLAELSGISRATISYIENGKAHNINISTLNALAQVLRCQVSDILEGIE